MNKALGIVFIVFMLALFSTSSVFAQSTAEYDVIIKNGRIINGSGNPWVSGDVGIRGDRIAKIGKLEGSTA